MNTSSKTNPDLSKLEQLKADHKKLLAMLNLAGDLNDKDWANQLCDGLERRLNIMEGRIGELEDPAAN